MLQAALLGGLFIGILSALPFISALNYCCCLWVTVGGLLAGYLDHQGQPGGVTPQRGALVGLLAGVIGALVWVFASMAVDVVMAPVQERMLRDMISSARDMPPEAREWLEMLAARGNAPLRYLLGFVLHLFAGAVFGTIGGILAASFFRKDVPPALGGPLPPPPPLPPA